MYKVFFNERKVILTHDFQKTFEENHGLFYKYHGINELKELLLLFLALKKITQLFICHPNVHHLFEEFSSCFRYVEAAGGLVRNSRGEVLFINRFETWDLPKGKIEADESADAAALREVEEECGINGMKIITELQPTYHTYFDKDLPHLKKTRWFEMNYNGRIKPKPQTEEFITRIVWAGEKELKIIRKNTWPSIIDLLKETSVLI
jgi:hypothetical protein